MTDSSMYGFRRHLGALMLGLALTVCAASAGAQPPPADLTPPDTFLYSTGYPDVSGNPSIPFYSNEQSVTFECQLAGQGWQPCTSPHSYSDLPTGEHLFEVRASASAGNTDASPAFVHLRVDATPPHIELTSAPAAVSGTRVADFFAHIRGEIYGFVVECRLDAGEWLPCVRYTDLAEGPHAWELRATDKYGNRAQVSHSWTIDLSVVETNLSRAPNGLVGNSSLVFQFSAGDGTSRTECRLDESAWLPCESPLDLRGIPDGPHVFRVRAVNDAGEADPTPGMAYFELNDKLWTEINSPGAFTRQLVDTLGEMPIGDLVHGNGFRTDFAGVAYTTVTVEIHSRGANTSKKSAGSLIARGQAVLRATGRRAFRVRLTRTGKSLLKAKRRVRAELRVTTVASGAKPSVTRRNITLRSKRQQP